MAGWIGPTVAIALVVIALCIAGMTWVMLRVALDVEAAAEEARTVLGALRQRVDPLVDSLTDLSATGTEALDVARHEITELAVTSRMVRSEVEHAVRRTRRRLADFDALVEVMQEEVEETALDVAVALQTVRASRSVLGRVGRLLTRRHDDEDDE